MDISKFLDKKKREISDKFNEGEASNRQTESSVDNFIANATSSEVFTESLKSEGCPAVLHNYMKIVERKMKKLRSHVWENIWESN